MFRKLFGNHNNALAKPRYWRHTPESLKSAFDGAYGSFGTAVCLCEGLEIIAANPACRILFADENIDLSGTLINSLLTDQEATTLLFDGNDVPTKTVLQRVNTDQPHHVQVTATPWPEQAHIWLLELIDLTEVKTLTGKLQSAISHDPVTGALWPGAFHQQVADRIESTTADRPGGLLGYVLVNTPGLTGGNRDQYLTDLAERFMSEFGPETLVARTNACTLSIFVEANRDGQESSHILRQLERLCPGATIAGADYPGGADTADQLAEAADLAFQIARESGEPKLFSVEMKDAETRRLKLAEDMPAAMAANSITPYFQPIIDSNSGHIKSFEALVRWIHPEFGYVFPPDIIAIAQESGLLHALTAHIIKQTINQMKDWPAPVQFAVNVTPSQLTGKLIDLVRESVRGAEIDPGRLEIEVTEDALIKDFEFSATMFARLRAIGVAVAMDDFGAGYTSVGNLRKLDFTKIKIDKVISDGLPHDKKSVAIVRSLMFMARELDVDVTVEGIEDEEQLDFLRAFDCGVQGYVFSRPLPKSDLPDMKKFLAPSLLEKHRETVVNLGPRITQEKARAATR